MRLTSFNNNHLSALLASFFVIFLFPFSADATDTTTTTTAPIKGSADLNCESRFIDHGMVAPVLRARGVAAMVDAEGKRVIIAQLMGSRGNLVIDADSGESTQVAAPFETWDSPFAFVRSKDNRLYTLFGNHFVEFDPETQQFTFCEAVLSRVAMAMIETEEGLIYSAIFPDSRLVAFDPESREITDYGSLNSESWSQYIRSMALGKDGWLYMGVGNVVGKIVAFHAETGQRKVLADPGGDTNGRGTIRYSTKDEQVYGSFPSDNSQWFLLAEGAASPIQVKPPSARLGESRNQGSIEPGFPDGSEIAIFDLPERFALIDEVDGTPRPLTYDYSVAVGPIVYSIAAGSDGKLHGSTGHPLRVYAFDISSGEFTDHGIRGVNGHWNAVTLQNGSIYAAQYGPADFWRYDPALEWNPGPRTESNPRLLTSTTPDIGRPHALLAHPDGRHVIMSGTPGYGMTGGGLVFYDTLSDELQKLTHTDLIPNHSTFSLAALPSGHLVGGTTRRAGTGGVPATGDARIYLFDMADRKLVWEGPVADELYEVSDLIVGTDGLVYGLATLQRIDGEVVFFVFDPDKREVLHQEKVAKEFGGMALSNAMEVMALAEDGSIYVLFKEGIARIELCRFKLEPIVNFFENGSEILPANPQGYTFIYRGRLYFPVESHLWSYQLPKITDNPSTFNSAEID